LTLSSYLKISDVSFSSSLFPDDSSSPSLDGNLAYSSLASLVKFSSKLQEDGCP
jgi:hypothetical protein